jgi:hypothetical protein
MRALLSNLGFDTKELHWIDRIGGVTAFYVAPSKRAAFEAKLRQHFVCGSVGVTIDLEYDPSVASPAMKRGASALEAKAMDDWAALQGGIRLRRWHQFTRLHWLKLAIARKIETVSPESWQFGEGRPSPSWRDIARHRRERAEAEAAAVVAAAAAC